MSAESLLSDLLSPSNPVRGAAEQALERAARESPSECVSALAASLSLARPELRGLGAVLLRRMLGRGEGALFARAGDAARGGVKDALLRALETEQVGGVRRKLCDSVAAVAALCFQDEANLWPELLPYMFVNASSPNSSNVQRENALDIFARLAEFLVHKFPASIPQMIQVLQLNLGHADLEVAVAAVKASAWLITSLDEETRMTDFKVLVPPIMNVVRNAAVLAAQDPTTTFAQTAPQSCMEDLIEVGGKFPRLFRGQDLKSTVATMVLLANESVARQRAQRETVEDVAERHHRGLAFYSLEFLCTLSEGAGAMMRKLGPPQDAFLVEFVGIMVKIMCLTPDMTPNDVTAWNRAIADKDMPENLNVGKSYLDRIVKALSPKRALPVVFSHVSRLLQLQHESEWKQRRCALLMLGSVVEFLPKEADKVTECVNLAVTFSRQDPNPVVRHAAVECMCRLAMDCFPLVQENNHEAFLAEIVHRLHDPSRKVQYLAASALINYCDEVSHEDNEELFDQALGPYITVLAEHLFGLLGTAELRVKEVVLMAISSISASAGVRFIPLYPTAMPLLRMALFSCPPTKEYDLFRIRAVDTMSLICASVGREVCQQDCVDMVEQVLTKLPVDNAAILDARADQDESDDMEAHDNHVLVAWMRVARVLGEDVLPRMQPAIQHALLMAGKRVKNLGNQHGPDVDDGGGGGDGAAGQEEEEGEEEEEVMDREAYEEFQDARTSMVDEKILGLQVLEEFCKHLGQGVLTFAGEVLKACTKELVTDQGEFPELHIHACLTLEALLKTLHKTKVLNQETCGMVMEALIVCLNAENPDSGALLEAVGLLRQVVAAWPRLVPTSQQDAMDGVSLDLVASAMVQLMKDSFQRRAVETAKRRMDEAENEIDEEAVEEFEQKVGSEYDLQMAISSVFTELVQVAPRAFVPLLFQQEWGSALLEMQAPGRLFHDRKMVVFVLDDALEWANHDMLLPYVPRMVQTLIAAATTTPNEYNGMGDLAALHHGAVFGLGVYGERFGHLPQFQDLTATVANVLSMWIHACPLAMREEEFSSAYDNAVSALCKLSRACPALPKVNEYMALWLSCLPMRGEDKIEARNNTRLLVDMCEAGHALVVQELVVAAKALIAALGTDMMNREDEDRALNVLLGWRTTRAQEMAVALQGVDAKDRARLLAVARLEERGLLA